MKVLITGAAGFIGSNLAIKCLSLGWQVHCVDDLSNGHLEFLPRSFDDLSCDDFASDDSLRAITKNQYDVVFHLAAVPRVSYSVEHPVESNDANVTKTLKLMNACRSNVGKFVFASSSSVYGSGSKIPTFESHTKRPSSPYALQKSIIEDYLRIYHELYDLPSVCLRFFNVFGNHALGTSSYATALAAWLTSIKQERPMRSDGDGSQSRDLCHVDNVVHACLKAVNSTVTNAECYNVACGKSTTNKGLLSYLLARYPNASIIDSPWRLGDVKHTLADIQKSKDELGYEPIVDVWDGVERTCDWYDRNWHWVKGLKQGI